MANDLGGPTYHPLQLLFILAGSAAVPDQDGEGEHAFNCGAVEVGHACSTDPKFLELSE